MPILDKSDEPHLKPWLIRTLEPICDADPTVLSDYVLALLKHDEPESQLRTGLEKQLAEFLEAEAPPFVEKLFRAIRNKSYKPYDDGMSTAHTPSSPSDGIRIPIDALVKRSPVAESRGTKRSAEDDPAANRPLPKGPRLSSEYGNGRGINGRGGPSSGPRYSDSRGRGGGRGSRPGPPGLPNRTPRSQEPCRDYHNMGYCPRGELCPFTHGDEAIVPPMPFVPPGANGMPLNPLQMMSMMQGGFPMPWMIDPSANGAYNPNEARMDMSGSGPVGPNGARRTNKPYQPTDAVDLSASISPNPQSQSDSTQRPIGQHQSPPPPSFPSLSPFPAPQNGLVPDGGANMNGNGAHPDSPFGGPNNFRGRGGGRGRGAYRGRSDNPGTFPNAEQQPNFDGDSPAPRPNGGARQDGNRTIVVEKIPRENLTLPSISDWFSKFGAVTNVAIDVPTTKALVSFSTPAEAKAAWSSQDAVFGNRFVKLFWHRPLAGHGEAGAKKLAASAPLVQNVVSAEKNGISSTTASSSASPMTGVITDVTATPTPTPAPAMTPAASIAARKEQLEKQIAEQKALFASLDTATTPEEKKEIMAKLRKLREEMKPSPSSSAQVQQRKTSTTTASASEDAKQKVIRAKLDRELEQSAASVSMSDPAGGSTDADGEENRQSALIAELAELRKQAAEAGVPSNVITGQPSAYRGRGSVRGSRGRGRGAFARGGGFAAPPRSLKLDNRPRKLVVKGVNMDDEGSLTAIEEFYKNVGTIESFHAEGSDEVHVQFQSRAMAEQAIAKGAAPGSNSVSWHTPARPANVSVPQPSTATNSLSGRSSSAGTLSLQATVADTADDSLQPDTIMSESKLDPRTNSDDITTSSTTPPTSTARTVTGHEDDDGGWGAGGGFDD